jgi:hypothetical protein
LVGVCALVLGFWVPPAIGCPGCKDALVEPSELPQRLGLARGFTVSIGVMLAVPAALLAGLAALIVRSAHRARTPSRRRIDTHRLSG